MLFDGKEKYEYIHRLFRKEERDVNVVGEEGGKGGKGGGVTLAQSRG